MWERIEWIIDIDRIIRLHPKINWNVIVQKAQKLKMTTMLYTALAIIFYYYKTPLPNTIQNKIFKNKLFTKILNYQNKKTLYDIESLKDMYINLYLLMQLQDNLYLSLRYAIKFILNTKKQDILFVNY